jgi:uncharacterized protein (TIGR03435 family)
LPEGKYDFVINTGREFETDSALLLQQALKSTFGVIGRKITQETNVFALRVSQPSAAGLVPTTTDAYSMRSAPGEMQGVCVSMAELAGALERSLNLPIVDETGLTNRYDVKLTWPHYPIEVADRELVKSVQQQLGLHLEPTKRPVEMWVVECKTPAKSHSAFQ